MKNNVLKKLLPLMTGAVLALALMLPASALKANGFDILISADKQSLEIKTYYRSSAQILSGYQAVVDRFGSEGTVVVPSDISVTVDDVTVMLPVRVLKSGAFEKTVNLKTVVLPDTIVTIEQGAIPDGVTVVRDYIPFMENDHSDPFVYSYLYVQGVITRATSANGLVYDNDEGALSIVGYTGKGGVVEIPASIDNCKVKTIATNALLSDAITEVRIPSGVNAAPNALGSYKVVLNYDAPKPIVIDPDPVAPTNENGETREQEIDIILPPGDDVSVAPSESSTDDEKTESGSEDETEPASGETGDKTEEEPSDETKESGDKQGGEPVVTKKMRPIDWILIGVASTVLLGAIIAIIFRFRKERIK